MSKADTLELAKKRFKAATEAFAQQTKREISDLRFQVPEMQWDDDARRSRLGQAVANVPIPPRPILSISKLDQPIQLVANQMRQAHLGINIHALSPDATDETAEVIQGIYRQIERDSQAQNARIWAFDRAIKAGMGWYRVNTAYDDAGGHPFDQVITIERVLYQEAVRIDPSAQKADFSDALYGFIGIWVPIEEFRRQFKGAKETGVEADEFASLLEKEPDWVKADGENKAILVCEYWYKDYETKTFVALQDGRAVAKDELEEDDEVDKEIEPRDKQVCTVKYCKLTGYEILEESEWNGRYIPLIPVIGRELQPFDQERRWVGIIGPAKDAQRGFNYAASSAVEIAALEPKAPWIGTFEQFEPYLQQWQQSMTRNMPFLPYKAVGGPGGQALPPPARTPIDSNRLGISMQLMQQFSTGIMETTQAFDPSLGQAQAPAQSGKAIQGLQGQSDLGNSHYLGNLADISMAYEAIVILDLIPAIYDRPGRLARTLDEEDESELVMLNQPHVIHPTTGKPLPMQQAPLQANGQPGPLQMPQGVPPSAPVKHYDLREGSYGVEVTIGKSYQSRLDQGNEFLNQMVQADPELMQIAGDIVFRFKDFPGATEVGDRLKALIQQKYPNLFQKPGEAPDPATLQAQLAGAQQHIQQLTQQLQQAQMIQQTEQIKHGAMIQREQIKTASDERIAQLEQQMQLMKAELQARTQLTVKGLEHGQAQGQAAMDSAHEVALAAATASKDAIHTQIAPAAPPVPAGGVPPFVASDPRSLGGEEPI